MHHVMQTETVEEIPPSHPLNHHEEMDEVEFQDEPQAQQQQQQEHEAQPPPFFAFFGLDEQKQQSTPADEPMSVAAAASEQPHNEEQQTQQQYQQQRDETTLEEGLHDDGDHDENEDVDDDDFVDDQSGVIKEGNDLLIMSGAVDIGQQATYHHQNHHFDANTMPIGAVIAEIAEDVDEEVVRQRIHEEIMQSAVQAQVVMPERKPFNRHLSGCVLLTVVAAIVTSLVAILSTRSHSTATPPSSSQGQSNDGPIATQAPMGDFPKTNISETILELLDNAKNHTLLASYFNRATSSAILDYVNTQVTLFAPTDDSFHALPVPYSYYPNSAWEDHLNFVLAYHMVTQPLNKVLIFSTNALPTVVVPYSTYDQLLTDATGPYLPVNRTGMTIGNGARLVVSDIQASNGYIQVPDRVLLSTDLRTSLFDYMFNGMANSASNFQALLEATGLQDLLMQNYSQGFTIFLPSDSSFASLDNATSELLFSSTEYATQVVSYHIAFANLYPSLIRTVGEQDVLMSNDVSALISSKGVAGSSNQYYINSAQILDFVFLRNGVIAFIDDVLLPASTDELLQLYTNVTVEYDFTTFMSLLHGAQLENLGFGNFSTNLTLFAPVETAFSQGSVASSLIAQLTTVPTSMWLGHLQSLVKNHFSAQLVSPNEHAGNYNVSLISGFDTTVQVTPNGNVTVNNDIKVIPFQSEVLHTTDGIMYAIDGVLLPPWVGVSIYKQAKQYPDLTTLVTLLNKYNYSSHLSDSQGPITIFAPDNTALQAIANNGNATFWKQILANHIFNGNLYSFDLGSTVQSQNNQTWAVSKVGSQTYVGGEKVLKSDVLGSNGVIHVIGGVLGVTASQI